MIKNKKVIGVCLTKINSVTTADYLHKLHHLSQHSDYKLIVFNSFLDFYNQDSFDQGAQAVYQIMNYSVIDALVVLYDSFYDKRVAEAIIATAREQSVPVLVVNGTSDGCWSILSDYDSAFCSLMNHVIQDHGISDPFFIAGNPDNDPESEHRIRCYRQVLEENGLVFRPDRVGYGHYWDEPTRELIQSLIKSGQKLPQAFFCANDYMALAVCDELKKYGIRVPDHVIVTGFDGVPAARHATPQITTCQEDLDELARITVETVTEALSGQTEPGVKKFRYLPVLSESCGCKEPDRDEFRSAISDLYHTVDEMEVHEDFMYDRIDRMLDITDLDGLRQTLAESILGNTYICLNSDFRSSITELTAGNRNHPFADTLEVIPSRYCDSSSCWSGTLSLSDMIPDISGWADDTTVYILNAIYVGSTVCGYYAVKTDSIMYCRHRVKRVLKTINIAFNIAINVFRQLDMRASLEQAALTNPITGLPNLKGAVKWFEEFSSVASHHRKPLTFSVYGLPKYVYIYENYGITEIEDTMRLVAKKLKKANPVDCYLAHIAEDTFLIINYYKSADQIADTINSATSSFFGQIGDYNNNSGKEYFVEVNCGCAEAQPGWDGSLEEFIKFANNEMYMNRLKMGMGQVVKEQEAPKEYYKAFNLLLEKNLFHYHFQPIVSAKTGEIYAYEALMRTDATIGMNPLEVLHAAREYNHLYEVEKLTLFNIIRRFAAEHEHFGNSRLFINTIPGHFLNDQDIDLLIQTYKPYLDSVVFELTEQDTVSDEELNSIKRLCGETSRSRIAIDDYGAGHSNIVNLMRYAPQIIKIDRFLISGIHNDQNKQMFVRNTIEFAQNNNIKVLAEGVETAEELRTVIDFGVDFIQGYYTGRPAPDPVGAIADAIRQEICDCHR
ncbi:MAG: EAL domain-containing protein [Lachnospiraceae bacterium]|nr:EAL domain-containing protein [Lachnospiraceae bacterium]